MLQLVSPRQSCGERLEESLAIKLVPQIVPHRTGRKQRLALVAAAAE